MPQERLAQALPSPTRHGRTPHRLRPWRHPGSPQPHGHQLSTYLLSESCSWPGTPSAEPQRRFPGVRRFASMAAKGACSSDPDGARRAPDTQSPAPAHSAGSRCERTGPPSSEPLHSWGLEACGGECQGLLQLEAEGPDTGQPLTLHPDGTAGLLRKAQGPAHSAESTAGAWKPL